MNSHRFFAAHHGSGVPTNRGSFELSYEIPPRYFMVTYDLKTELDSTHVTKVSEYEEHRALVKTAVENRRIVLNGETLDIHDDKNTNFAISENSPKGADELLKP